MGLVTAIGSVLLLAFSILLAFKLEDETIYDYYFVFVPVWLICLGFLGISQARRITEKLPVLGRLVWTLFVASWLVSTALTAIHVQYHKVALLGVFLPLYIFCFMALVFGCLGLVVAICTNDSQRQSRYLCVGIPSLVFDAVLTPVVILCHLKIDNDPTDLEWVDVFIPLWVSDVVAFYVGLLLLIFTCGSQSSARFTIHQVSMFLVLIPCSIVFKILLALVLDQKIQLSFHIVMIPLYVACFILFMCGLNIHFRKNVPLDDDDEHLYYDKELRNSSLV